MRSRPSAVGRFFPMASSRFSNLLLNQLSRDDLARLEAAMSPVILPQKHHLVHPNQPIATCYFLESGVASVTLSTAEGKQAEIGIIGNEGMIDASVALGSTSSPLEVFMQVPGAGHAVPAADVIALSESSKDFRAVLLAFTNSFMIQMSHSLLATLTLTLDGRLARWLLMSRDRTSGDTFPMTHEFLSLMLGSRRAGVTDALNRLCAAGLVETRRGQITILNRKGLEARAGDSYALQDRDFRALYA